METTLEKNIQKIIQELPQSLQLEVWHYVSFLKSNFIEKNIDISEIVQESGIIQDNVDLSEKRNGFGSLKGKIWMSDDFDEPLEEFKEYM